MNTTIREVLTFVKENDIQFIRLSFCDMFGLSKNISIMADALPDAFTEGVSFDANAIRGFKGVVDSDLLLFPDPSTITVLPWRPGPGRVARFYCDIKNPDGSAFLDDGRTLLKQVIARAEKMGYVCSIGAECEFYLFKTDDKGCPSQETYDNGGYSDIAPLDRGEDIRREICLTLAEMGITPEASHHEQGPGQNEVDFKFSGALACADNLQSFKAAVKAIAARNGLFASFMPKPIVDAPGSGMHVNISLNREGHNIFEPASNHSVVAESFIAGILARTAEMTAFLNPLTNSYERFGKFEAPAYVSWSHQNRSQLIRIPAAKGKRARMELRSPDPSANPYLAFALILAAGLEGIEKGLPLSAPVNEDLYAAASTVTKQLVTLPSSLETACSLAASSDFIKQVLGEELLAKYLSVKQAEASDFRAAKDKAAYYRDKYFSTI